MVAHRAAHRDGRAAAARAAGVVILDHAVHIDDNMRGIRVVRQRNRNGRTAEARRIVVVAIAVVLTAGIAAAVIIRRVIVRCALALGDLDVDDSALCDLRARILRLPYDRTGLSGALDLVHRADGQTLFRQGLFRLVLCHAEQTGHSNVFVIVLLLALADIDGQRRALFQLSACLRVGADDLAFLHVVAVFLNNLALDVVRCQRRLYIIERLAGKVDHLVGILDVFAARGHRYRDDRTLGCLFLAVAVRVLLEYLTDRTVGFLPFGRFLHREVVGYIRVGQHFVDIASDEIGHDNLLRLVTAAGDDQNADQQQTDHRDHADRHADRHAGTLGQLFKKAVRLILLLFAETGAGAGLRARAGARRSCALNGSGFMLCRTAARRALNVRADDLRLARVVLACHIVEPRVRVSAQHLHILVHLFRGLVPAADVRTHGVHDNVVHALWNARHKRARDDRHLIDVLHDDLECGFALKRQLAGQHFVHHHAERVQVGAVIDLAALGLLRRDIVHRADGLLHHAGLLRGSERGNAEIGQLCRTVPQDDNVLRLNVLMDDAARVCVHECAGNLLSEENGLLPRQMALALQILLEGDALDQLHNDIIRAVLAADVEHGNNIVVAQLGNGARLNGEPLADIRVLRELFFEHLECHIAPENGIPRPVNDRHAANADDFLNLIASAEHTADIFIHSPSRSLLFAEGEQRNGDVVAAAAVKRQLQQRVTGQLERRRVCQHLRDPAVLRHAGQTVRAEQQHVLFGQAHFKQVAFDIRLHAYRTGDEVFLRMGARIRLGDLAAAAHFLHIGVVLADLVHGFAVKAVRAAVAHVDNGRAVALNERGNQGRAHAAELRLPARQRENRLVRLLERLRQQVLPSRFVQRAA